MGNGAEAAEMAMVGEWTDRGDSLLKGFRRGERADVGVFGDGGSGKPVGVWGDGGNGRVVGSPCSWPTGVCLLCTGFRSGEDGVVGEL